MSEHGYFSEAAYNTALEGIAQGATKGETLVFICKRYGLSAEDGQRVLPSALQDALDVGVEDIDPSWFRR